MFPIEASSFAELFANGQIAIYLGISVFNAILLFYASLKFLLVLQQCGYKGRRYFNWLYSRETPYRSRLMLLCLLGLLFSMVLSMCFSALIGETSAQYIGFASQLLFTVMYIKSESSVNAKVPLKKTKRLVRLCISYFAVLFAFTFGVIVLLNYIAFAVNSPVLALLRYSVLCLIPMLAPYLLFLAYGLNEPYEEMRKKHFLRLAKTKLDSLDILKIGITGSYGKTTVKEILKTILSTKYRVMATPESYNTPLGIALTVKKLDSTHDVFIAEMGARSKGDIEALAKLVSPQYGVLTGVNNQHLETFKDIETTKSTKFELFENLSGEQKAFFSTDNDASVELSAKYDGEKYFAGLSGEDNLVTATDIVMDGRGMTFKLKIKGEDAVECSTVLLGNHSVKNICLASAVAYKIGLTAKEIALGIGRIQSIGHRLELVPNNKNIIIIDDSYNSNEDGTKAAMQVLDTFEGRKIVLTPGLVELGKMESVMNLEFGRRLAKHADIVIVIGNHNSETIINGLIDGGMDRENIKFAKSLNKGNEILSEILKEGDVVLFENDLPDNYN
ncbi:MAG: UDP-N-acetylmuramoyl-tripeptide--D-alanyl-D-alanine ligase [Clostridia bacterium]|nr:UDP-N-acetylmuramoyl-tripeptide--D-alanyl-D-alanine ligase [Clostridia bacterium]